MTTLAVTSANANSLLCEASTWFHIGSELSLDSVDADRDAIDEPARLRVLHKHGSKHAWTMLRIRGHKAALGC
jgi:hypothetical protein